MSALLSASDRGLSRDTLVLEPRQRRCEIADVDDVDSHRAKREACLCEAALGSRRAAAIDRRINLRVRHISPEVVDRPKPESAVIEATGNFRAWTSYQSKKAGSVQRLAVEQLGALQAPLSRCTVPAGTLVVVDVAVGASGVVTSATVSLPRSPAFGACVERTIRERGAFDCTLDGEPGQLRLALQWP